MARIDTLKNTLRVRLPSEINLNDFIKTEMTLIVLEYCAPNEDACQAYLLIHNYTLIGNISEPKEAAFLQKAHICLRCCSSKQHWLQLLKHYREDVPEELRFYEFTEEMVNGKKKLKLIRNERSTIVSDRAEIYLEYINKFNEKHSSNYAKEGKYQFWLGSDDKP